MHALLPLEEISRRFDKPVHLEQLGIDRLPEIFKRDPDRILNTGFTVWDRYARTNPSVQRTAVREHLHKHGGTFLDAASAIIGEPIIKDICFSRCTVDDASLDYNLVAYLLAAHVYPNNLHLADIILVNPYKPLPIAPTRYKMRRYKGLGLLSTVMSRAEAYAVEQGCDHMTLTADADDVVPLFARFGFLVEEGEVASLAMEKKVLR